MKRPMSCWWQKWSAVQENENEIYACLERGTHGKEDATVRLFCNEKGVDMQVRVAAWQFMIFDKDAGLVGMEYAEALANLQLSHMEAEDMITRFGTEKTEVSMMEPIMEERMGSISQVESMQVDEMARGCCGFDWWSTFIEVRVQAVRLKLRPRPAVRLTLAI